LLTAKEAEEIAAIQTLRHAAVLALIAPSRPAVGPPAAKVFRKS
jgi:hypothetical protein